METNSTDTQSKKPKDNKFIILVMGAVIIILLAVLAGGGIFLATRDNDSNSNSNTSANNSNENNSTVTPKSTKPAIATSKMTSTTAYELELTGLVTTGNNVRLEMNMSCVSAKGCATSAL